jgi:hypothetical protein
MRKSEVVREQLACCCWPSDESLVNRLYLLRVHYKSPGNESVAGKTERNEANFRLRMVNSCSISPTIEPS